MKITRLDLAEIGAHDSRYMSYRRVCVSIITVQGGIHRDCSHYCINVHHVRMEATVGIICMHQTHDAPAESRERRHIGERTEQLSACTDMVGELGAECVAMLQK